MAHIPRSVLGLFFFLRGLSTEDLLCYSCFSLNYRSQVAPRNGTPPPPQSFANLSEVVALGVGVPPLTDSCADVSLTSQPSFISVPRVVCRAEAPFCAKLVFLYKGEKVVFRDCFAHPRPGYRHDCADDPRSFSRLVFNSTLCTCRHSLCNGTSSSPYSFIIFGFICSVLFYV